MKRRHGQRMLSFPIPLRSLSAVHSERFARVFQTLNALCAKQPTAASGRIVTVARRAVPGHIRTAKYFAHSSHSPTVISLYYHYRGG